MNQDLKEQASLYVLDRLGLMERTDFESRMANDPALLELVREMESSLEDQVRALPSHQAPEDAWAAIDARLNALSVDEEEQSSKVFTFSAWTGWGVAAALMIVLGLTLLKEPAQVGIPEGYWVVDLAPQQSSSEWLSGSGALQKEGSRFFELAALAQGLWEDPRSDKMTASQSHGFAIIDPVEGSGFIGVQELPPVSQGKCYLVWAVDPASRRVIPVGLLPLGSSDDGMFSINLREHASPSSEQHHWNFFITEEQLPQGSISDELPQEPSGPLVLGYNDI